MDANVENILIECGFPELIDIFKVINPIKRNSAEKIVGGHYTSIRKAPYQVSLQYMKRHTCGGSIISAKWAVTAGHCVFEKSGAIENFRIHSGSSFRYVSGTNHKVKRIKIHEKYDDMFEMFDIALIEVAEPFKTSAKKEQKIQLPEADTIPPEGAPVTASGWGTILDGWNVPPVTLKYVDVKIQNWDQCKKKYRKVEVNVTRHMICAGHRKPGHDACQGDSGGPLALKYKGEPVLLVGVVSTGYGCGVSGYPGIYTNVGSFRKWIKKHTGV